MPKVTLHHIGCAVERLEDGIAAYGRSLGFKTRTRSFDIASQHVRVCFIELSDHFYLELVSPLNDEAGLRSYLRAGFYHLCFLVDDLAMIREELRAERFLALRAFESDAFAGNCCQFFFTPQQQLIEFVQMPVREFANHFSANLDNEFGL
jgi:catechol 2,3-dioxygenase-like lactoylglutathione lyase family enzyme